MHTSYSDCIVVVICYANPAVCFHCFLRTNCKRWKHTYALETFVAWITITDLGCKILLDIFISMGSFTNHAKYLLLASLLDVFDVFFRFVSKFWQKKHFFQNLCLLKIGHIFSLELARQPIEIIHTNIRIWVLYSCLSIAFGIWKSA